MTTPLRKLGGVSDLHIEKQENGKPYRGYRIGEIDEDSYIVIDDRGVEGFGITFSSVEEAEDAIDQLVIDNGQFGVGA